MGADAEVGEGPFSAFRVLGGTRGAGPKIGQIA